MSTAATDPATIQAVPDVELDDTDCVPVAGAKGTDARRHPTCPGLSRTDGCADRLGGHATPSLSPGRSRRDGCGGRSATDPTVDDP